MMNKARLSCMVTAAFLAAVPAAALAGQAPGVRAAPGPLKLLPAPRKSITQLSATELASLRKGFAQMIAWNSAPRGSANFKRSLVYWANMHAYIGAGCSPNSGLNYPGMSGISAQSKSTPDENATWCTCQHGTIQFLTWHRMYLYYFEKVLQAAAGDPKLRLPFWDYETDGHVPPAYRSPTYVNGQGQTVPNPLYIANRQAQLNSGAAALSASVVSTAGAMPAKSYSPFNSAIEQTPHGAVHCATGVQSCPSGYMGYVPTAGNDPIFYSHHANIDRLYECWVQVDPTKRLPGGAVLTASFSFIDGAGNLVTRVVGDMLTTAQLGYTYTAGGGCPAVRLARPPLVLQEQPFQVIPLLGETRLPANQRRVPIRAVPELRAGLGAAAGGQPVRNATLVLEGVGVDDAPGGLFEVALQRGNGRKVVVGVINSFNATAPGHEGMAAMDDGRRAFDATAAVQALGAGEAQLVVEPTSGVATGNVALAATGPSARAGIHFSAARLELR
jgi:hypothetical protein